MCYYNNESAMIMWGDFKIKRRFTHKLSIAIGDKMSCKKLPSECEVYCLRIVEEKLKESKKL